MSQTKVIGPNSIMIIDGIDLSNPPDFKFRSDDTIYISKVITLLLMGIKQYLQSKILIKKIRG